MRVLFLLASCLLAFVSADSSQSNPLSLVGKGAKAVASPVGKVADTVGSNTLDAAQTVGQGISKGLQTAGNVSEDAARTVGRGVQKEVQAVKQPIDTTIAYIGSSQCKNVQKIFGVSYEQIQGEQEPDLSSLEIVYKTQSFRTIINITDAPASLRQARKFEDDSRLVLFLHGFTDDPAQQSFATISQAYLDEGHHMSILALDASSLIHWFYIRAVTFVRFIGTALGKVLAQMYKEGQDPKKIHIIGHSLGAHIGAFTAKTFEKLTGHKIGRISGLDPAGPCFSFVEPDLRLKKTDAAYVDVIHTDAGVYGIEDAVGHKDYYPNSGSLQPNCLLQTCSHSRVWRLYAESVQSPRAFPAVRCASWAAFKKGDCEWDKISYMGHPSTPGDEGHYFLQTGEDSPYGLGLNGTKYRNNEGLVRNVYNFVG